MPIPGRPLTEAPFETTEWSPAGTGRHPLVLLLHGAGGPGFFLERSEYMRYPEALAGAGFRVVMPHYAESDAAAPAALRTILDWLARTPGADVSHVGVVGFSRGGFIGSCVAGTDPRIAAFASCYGGLDDGCSERITRMPPALVLHGEADPVVPVENAARLAAFARAHGAVADVHTYPGQEHIFLADALDDSIARIVSFFGEHLR